MSRLIGLKIADLLGVLSVISAIVVQQILGLFRTHLQARQEYHRQVVTASLHAPVQ